MIDSDTAGDLYDLIANVKSAYQALSSKINDIRLDADDPAAWETMSEDVYRSEGILEIVEEQIDALQRTGDVSH
jgi:hypothetical protein